MTLIKNTLMTDGLYLQEWIIADLSNIGEIETSNLAIGSVVLTANYDIRLWSGSAWIARA